MATLDHITPQTDAGRKIKAAMEAARSGQPPPAPRPPDPVPPPPATVIPLKPAERAKAIRLNKAAIEELRRIEGVIVKWEDENFTKLGDEKIQDQWIKYHATLEKVRGEISRRTVPSAVLSSPKKQYSKLTNESSQTQRKLFD